MSREWSAYQRAIFQDVAEGEGHTVVVARAGSGKTSTIVESFNHVPRGLTVLMCAFNKAIANELKVRAPRHVEVSTLHGYGLKAVTRAYGRVQIDGDRVHGLVKAAHGEEYATLERRRALAKAVSLAKGQLAGTAEEIDALVDAFGLEAGETEAARAEFSRDALAILEQCKRVEGSIDFDDMVWLPVVHGLRCHQFDRVFIDETQDLNRAQIELALKAVKTGFGARGGGRICAVGDDRQAIYAFRGADKDAVSNVVAKLGAKVMPLSVTYRCARSIVGVAKTIVPDIEAAPGAAEGSVEDCDEKRMMREARAGDFVLSRANAPLVRVCLAFLREGRRANIQGRDVGAQLSGLVKKAGIGSTVAGMLQYVDEWAARECARLGKKNPPGDTQSVEDKAATIGVLAEGAASVADVLAKIEALFSDVDDTGRITLSSTHKAKGLERDRAWVLRDTYQRRPGVEEDNLFYVAATRAREALFLVTEPHPEKAR
jgi:DNA helicase-2/ATP-dependent DNA helicase PcrA